MRAVFLDRDGVINVNRTDHVLCWEQFSFLPGALAALAALRQAEIPCFVITNQAIVGRGIASAQAIEEIHWRMCEVVRRSGGRIEAVAYCPHRPDERCACRKPQPGMLLSLAETYSIDLRASYVVGDALTDLEAGAAAGCQTILVMTGRGRQQARKPDAIRWLPGSQVAADLGSAARLIVHTRHDWRAPANRHLWPEPAYGIEAARLSATLNESSPS